MSAPYSKGLCNNSNECGLENPNRCYNWRDGTYSELNSSESGIVAQVCSNLVLNCVNRNQ